MIYKSAKYDLPNSPNSPNSPKLQIATISRRRQDNVFVTVVISVQYECMIKKAYEAYYKLSNAEVQIQS